MSDSRSIEVLKLQKVSLKGYDVEASYISQVDIYESLTQPGITGFISIQDYQGFRELGNIFAGDEIVLSFGCMGEEAEALELKFVIFTDEGSKVLPQNTYDVLQLGFCSKWMIDALCKSVSKPYTDKFIHEIIEDILLTECSDAKIGYIEPTFQKLEHFLSPRWTPFHTIKYLMSFALNQQKIGGYVCWTDIKTDKINVTTLDYLMKGSLGETENSFVILPGNKRYGGRVKHLDFEGSYDTIRMVNNGTYNSIFYGFNYDKNEILTSKEKIKDIKATRLSKKLPIQNKFTTDDKYARYKFTPLFPNTDYSIANDDSKIDNLVKGTLFNSYAFLSSDIFKINVESIGDTKRRVGQLALLEYPSQNSNVGSNDDNEQLKSKYLIREIRHSFSPYIDYKQFITLTIDGYQKYDADMVEW